METIESKNFAAQQADTRSLPIKLFDDAYQAVSDMVREHPYATAAGAVAAVALTAGALYFTRGRVAGLVQKEISASRGLAGAAEVLAGEAAPTATRVSRVQLVGNGGPFLRTLANPTVEDTAFLRSTETLNCSRFLSSSRQFVVTSGEPVKWLEATHAGDKRVQVLFTGREMFYKGKDLSYLGPEQNILLQHFNCLTEPINAGLAAKADLLMCCHPERLSPAFRANHVRPELVGKLNIRMLNENVPGLPSGRALTIGVSDVPTLKQLTHSSMF